MTIEERKNAIIEKIAEQKAVEAYEERIAALEESDAMLMECVLEMSEIVYA